jgi:hypothetical protein
MVNIIIYLEQTINAQHLVEDLLKEQLFANVTIDKENVSYKIENGEIVTTIKTPSRASISKAVLVCTLFIESILYLAIPISRKH